MFPAGSKQEIIKKMGGTQRNLGQGQSKRYTQENTQTPTPWWKQQKQFKEIVGWGENLTKNRKKKAIFLGKDPIWKPAPKT